MIVKFSRYNQIYIGLQATGVYFGCRIGNKFAYSTDAALDH